MGPRIREDTGGGGQGEGVGPAGWVRSRIAVWGARWDSGFRLSQREDTSGVTPRHRPLLAQGRVGILQSAALRSE